MSKTKAHDDGFGLQAPAITLKTRKRKEGEEENAFEQLVARPEDDPDVAPDPALRRGPKRDRQGDTVLYEAGDPLANPNAWPAVVQPKAAENGHSEGGLDGDSAVVLVNVINALQQHLGEAHAFADTIAGGQAVIKATTIPHLLRFIVRAAGPVLIALLEAGGLDAAEKSALRSLIKATKAGTSVVRERDERERIRRNAEAAERAARVKRQAELRAKAEALVAAEETEAKEKRIAEKLKAISST